MNDIIDGDLPAFAGPPEFEGLSDSPSGGKQLYDFDPPRDVISLVFVDHDNNVAEAITYDENGQQIKSVIIPKAGDLSVQMIEIDSPNTSRLVIDIMILEESHK